MNNSTVSSPSRVSLAAQILRESGYVGLAQRATGYLYRRTLRRILPRATVRYAGVAVAKDRKIGDLIVLASWVPPDLRDIPSYEQTLIGGIREHVRIGDHVVVVGGGEGVSSTIAAQLAGDSGSVVCFEGALDCATSVEIAARRNGVGHRLTVRHAVVGTAIGIYGPKELQSTVVIDPADLPRCDVLELDCEGAEITILKTMRIAPRAIVVETHGLYGAPTMKVRQLLEDRGYNVFDLGWAEPRTVDYCMEHDVRVLAGTLVAFSMAIQKGAALPARTYPE